MPRARDEFKKIGDRQRQATEAAKRRALSEAGARAQESPMFGTIEMGGVVYECQDMTMTSDVVGDGNGHRFRVRVVVGKVGGKSKAADPADVGLASVNRGRAAIEAVAQGHIDTSTLISVEKARTALSEDRDLIVRTLALLEQVDLVTRGRLRAERNLGTRMHGAPD